MPNRVTIQDIAAELGLSRNTVSKAINNTGILADATRERILQKAREMGYKQFSYAHMIREEEKERRQPVVPPAGGEIALLTSVFLGNSHFSSTMLDKFQQEISQLGYSMTMHRVSTEELRHCQLPNSLNIARTDAVICFEIFDYHYSQMLCSLDVPALFVDSPVLAMEQPLKADCLYMSNIPAVQSIVREMAHRGKKRMGFVGDYLHCQSFYERYIGFLDAMRAFHLPVGEEYLIPYLTDPNTEVPSTEDTVRFFCEKIKAMPELPEVLLCSNDFVALDVLKALRCLGLSVPEDICLCGFDDSSESSIVTPPLTTVHIHSQVMGFSAAQLLIARLREPSLNYRTVYTETEPIFRRSTGD